MSIDRDGSCCLGIDFYVDAAVFSKLVVTIIVVAFLVTIASCAVLGAMAGIDVADVTTTEYVAVTTGNALGSADCATMDVDISNAEDIALRTEVHGPLFFIGHPAITIPAVETTTSAEDVTFDGTFIHIYVRFASFGDKRLTIILALDRATTDRTDLAATI